MSNNIFDQYHQHKLASFCYSTNPSEWNNLKPTRLKWMSQLLRLSVWLLLLEILATLLVIPFHLSWTFGVSMSTLATFTLVLVVINALSLLVVSPRSLPFYVRLRLWLQQKRWSKITDENYQVQLNQIRNHDVIRGFFRLDGFECPVAWVKSRQPSSHWIIFIPGAGSLPGDYTDIKKAVHEINHLFGDHQHILVVNRPTTTFWQRVTGRYHSQTPVDSIKCAALFAFHHKATQIIWYGHCMGAVLMSEAYSQMKTQNLLGSCHHKMVLDRTFSSVSTLLKGIPLLSFSIMLSGFNYRIHQDIPKECMVIIGKNDMVIPPFAEPSDLTNAQYLLLPLGHLDPIFRLDPEITKPLKLFLSDHTGSNTVT
ncbi:MAG: hypothetical protein ACON5A_01305 [Candidatus Comchoanobacterales bacterium]